MQPEHRIRVSPDHPFYWHYKNRTMVLIGGSSEDNLFQVPDVAKELDLIRSCGGNAVRCTMSSRDEGNVWAFEKDDRGQYDLTRPSDIYWEERFRRSLNPNRGAILRLPNPPTRTVYGS